MSADQGKFFPADHAHEDEPHPPAPGPHPHDSAEFDGDLNVPAILWTTAAVIATCIVSAILMWGLFAGFDAFDRHGQPARPTPGTTGMMRQGPAPEPSLQPSPTADMITMRERDDSVLGHGAWVDHGQGTVRLPIDVAIDVLAARGLPRVTTPPLAEMAAHGSMAEEGRPPTDQPSPGTLLPPPGVGIANIGPPSAGVRGLLAAAAAAPGLAAAPAGRPAQAPEPFMQYGLAPSAPAVPPSGAPGYGGGTAGAAGGMPSPFQRLGFDQRVGEQVPPGLAFRDEQGRAVRIGDYFGRRPVVLALVYYGCPMLCPLTLGGLARSLKGMSFDAGREYEVVAVSIDPRETPAMAAAAKDRVVRAYGRPETAAAFHFLTGAAEPIRRLTGAVGFRYFWDPRARQYAHPAGIVLLTRQGAASRYLYGIEFPPRNVRLGLVEAAGNRIGSPVDQVLLYCFHYDPAQGRYSATALNIVRLTALLCVAGLALLVALLLRREHARPNRLGTA